MPTFGMTSVPMIRGKPFEFSIMIILQNILHTRFGSGYRYLEHYSVHSLFQSHYRSNNIVQLSAKLAKSPN